MSRVVKDQCRCHGLCKPSPASHLVLLPSHRETTAKLRLRTSRVFLSVHCAYAVANRDAAEESSSEFGGKVGKDVAIISCVCWKGTKKGLRLYRWGGAPSLPKLGQQPPFNLLEGASGTHTEQQGAAKSWTSEAGVAGSGRLARSGPTRLDSITSAIHCPKIPEVR